MAGDRYLVNGLLVWINKACDGPDAHKVAEKIEHLLGKTLPNIIFIWSGKMILGLGFASLNITLPDQINMILVSVLSNKCILLRNSNSMIYRAIVRCYCAITRCYCYYILLICKLIS